jgi:hypothetical protein
VLQVLSLYLLGAWILSAFGPFPVLLYWLFCFWADYRVLKLSCRYCFYYGQLCGTGKGLVVPLFFKKGDPKVFLEKTIGWRELLPDLLVLLIPLLGGTIYLFRQFNFLTLGSLVALVLLALPATGALRSCLLCPNCRQRELGCPADKLFNKRPAA